MRRARFGVAAITTSDEARALTELGAQFNSGIGLTVVTENSLHGSIDRHEADGPEALLVADLSRMPPYPKGSLWAESRRQ